VLSRIEYKWYIILLLLIQSSHLIGQSSGEKTSLLIESTNLIDKTEGNKPNQLAIPMGIAVNNNGDLFVADTYNHRVQLWEKGATKGRTLISGKDFNPDSQINYFSGISLVNDSFLYITDYQQKRIIRYDLETDTFKIISTNDTIENEEDKLSQPYQTAVNIMGDLIIADAKNNRIQKRKIENE
tara:strand:+ start:500 stop:1051 length:552 start_codon:yes stop_codon:yes gene_type:complete